MKIEFNKENHIYSLAGEIVPSVTQIISTVFSYAYGDETARRRGTAVHKAIHLLEEGTLDWTSVDDRIKMYVLAYQNFNTDFKLDVIATEERIYNSVYSYAGTLDMRTQDAIYDFKTGSGYFTHGLQLAAYCEAIENSLDSSKQRLKRFGVYLSDDGTYKTQQYEDKSDLYDFIACLRIYKRKKKENLL